MKVKDIIKVTDGKLLSGNPDTDIDPAKFSTDSRAIKNGEFFIALKGANFDGNEFVGDVLKRGAIGAIVTREQEHKSTRAQEHKSTGAGKIIIQVRDTTKALQDIAAHHRKQFNIPVVCITGSNGKTTVKDMARHLLSTHFNVLSNEGTKNNHIGVPQTLLKLNLKHQICVLELGTNHKGEIALLAGIARPTVAVFTNIGPSHLEFLGSLKGVFEAKKEMLQDLDREHGLVILNGDDEFLSKIKGKNIVRYGFDKSNDLAAEVRSSGSGKIHFTVNNEMGFELNLLGNHNVNNALAAIAIALNFGLSYRMIRKAFLAYKPTHMRLEPDRIRGIDILNDSYNSNPGSMMRALEAVKLYPAKSKWIVSGDMLELGRESKYFHKMIGECIAKSGFEGLVTFGELSKQTLSQAKAKGMREDRLWHCSTHDEIAGLLKKVVRKGDVVLIKGSRSMRMEKVLEKMR